MSEPIDHRDMLVAIFERQAALMERMPTKRLTEEDCEYDNFIPNLQSLPPEIRQEIFREIAYSADKIGAEAHELKDWTPWKNWSKNIGNKDPRFPVEKIGSVEHMREIVFEQIDLVHFVVESFLVLGIGPEEMMALYDIKNSINHDRQNSGSY